MPIGDRNIENEDLPKRPKPIPRQRKSKISPIQDPLPNAEESRITENVNHDESDIDDVVILRKPVHRDPGQGNTAADTERNTERDVDVDLSPSQSNIDPTNEAYIDNDENTVNSGSTGNEDDETAHNSAHNDDVGNSNADDDEENSENNESIEHNSTDNVVRRPVRARQKPAWMRTGEFHMKMDVREPEWKERAEYLRQIASSDLFDKTDSSVLTATLLNIVSGK